MSLRIWTSFLLVLAGVTAIAWLVALMREKSIRPVQKLVTVFRKQSKVGRVLLGTFFIVLWIIAGTKPGDGDGSVAHVEILPMPNTDVQSAGSSQLGTGNNFTMATLLTSTNTPRTLTDADFERGFVMYRAGTNETFDFSASSNAVACADWRSFGAATDWIHLAFEDWAFQLGTNEVDRLRVFSFGKVDPFVRDAEGNIATNNWLAPFLTNLGIVPEANWTLLDESVRPSQMWYAITPEGSLLVTWQNALLGRDTDKPVSIQIELKADGQFIYRYDLSRLNVGTVSNILAGASFGGNEWMTNALPKNVTSMAFYPPSEEDILNQDRDGDGLATIDELFFYRTDPNNPDTDYDGLTDYEELSVYNSDPLDAYSLCSEYSDGLAAKLGGLTPFSYPEGSTNTVLEHIFYSGATNGVVVYPQSGIDTAVLKIRVSGSGTGRMVVGGEVVPLVPKPMSRSGVQTNTLLLAVGKGVRKEIWFAKPDELSVAIDSDDFLIGNMPTWYWPHGWLAFPHTDATIPCIHRLNDKVKRVALVHGEEFAGLTATWSSTAGDVAITNESPVSADIYGSFSKDETRAVSYTVNHPKQLNSVIATFGQTLRFCPQFDENEDPEYGVGGGSSGGDGSPGYGTCNCPSGGSCGCCTDEWCHCGNWNCPCNVNRDPTIGENDSEEEEAFANMVAGVLQPLTDVFYLYRANSRTVHLDVPGGEPKKCCPCPEHWASNYVAKAYCSGLLSVSGDFQIAYAPCDVTVSGISPSLEFRDAGLLFVTNGTACKRLDGTVLGVGFESCGGRPELSEYNRKSSSLGFPIPVGTNFENVVGLTLKTDVLLENGILRLAIERASPAGCHQIWLPAWHDAAGNRHPREMLLDSETRPERYLAIRKWRNILRRYGNDCRRLQVILVSPQSGSFDAKIEFAASDGTNYVHDFATQRVTSINPLLLVDYDRDGAIDGDDVQSYVEGRVFRYWINECKITGAVWEELSMFEQLIDSLSGLENWRNQRVDGAYDLVNLFPVAVNFNPFLQRWGNGLSFKITSVDGADRFNYTVCEISHLQAGSIRTSPVADTDGNSLTNAPLTRLTGDGLVLSGSAAAGFNPGSCLMAVEARASSANGLKMTVLVDGEEWYACTLPMSMSSVDSMFRFVNIRGAHEDEMTEFAGTNAPPNNPDCELADKDVFFVHGFNVTEGGARDWNREIFKRLWVSGLNARYWGVTWSGDSGLVNELHYHRDVRQALMSATSFKNLVNRHGHDSVVMGHSLGNMVVSEALLKGANAKTYIMLDAAVASEAYSPNLQAGDAELVEKYVPSDWSGYDNRTWASNWYSWFTNNASDARAEIGWAGHFSPILNRPGLTVYNFYSTGDEVFDESDSAPGLTTGVFHWPTLNLEWPFFHLNWTPGAYPWQKQEVFKGVNVAGSLSAGWGFHCWAEADPDNFGETIWLNYSAAEANAMVADGSIVTNAVFDRSVSAMFSATISDYEKADILAFHIPAVSSPAGKVAVRTAPNEQLPKDYDLNNSFYRANGWGRFDPDDPNALMSWLHSDIKNMAYFHVYPVFTEIVEKGEMK